MEIPVGRPVEAVRLPPKKAAPFFVSRAYPLNYFSVSRLDSPEPDVLEQRGLRESSSAWQRTW